MKTLEAKDPNVDARYLIDARAFAYQEMQRDFPYGLGEITRAPRHTGFYYECAKVGDTRAHWPDAWPCAEGVEFADGSVIWITRDPEAGNLPTITAVSWTVDKSGLSVVSETMERGLIRPLVTGGTDGETYKLTARITWSNSQVDEITVAIPVEQQ